MAPVIKYLIYKENIPPTQKIEYRKEKEMNGEFYI